MRSPAVVCTVFILCACGGTYAPRPSPRPAETVVRVTRYEPSSTCRNCHTHIYNEHRKSAHALSFVNPVFQAQYFSELLPRLEQEPHLKAEASRCIACHAPIAYATWGKSITTPTQISVRDSGVTCDFCHRLEGFKGHVPGNGQFVSTPGSQKFGPFKHKGDWHHVYREFVTKSTYCAVCHQAVNHRGLEIKGTYREWRKSAFSKQGIQCQDCHMNLHGFLLSGKPVYEYGKAARLAQAPSRKKLYTHRFPGAHSGTQIKDSLSVRFTIGNHAVAGTEFSFFIIVDNRKTGHSMPSGSADLRAIVLEVCAHTGNWSATVPASAVSGSRPAYEIFGNGPFDRKDIETLGLEEGSRVYRSIFLDDTGCPTLSSYRACRIAFDNRLEAGEHRLEAYAMRLPKDLASGRLRLSARLYYLSYPAEFGARLDLNPAEPILIAEAVAEVVILDGGDETMPPEQRNEASALP